MAIERNTSKLWKYMLLFSSLFYLEGFIYWCAANTEEKHEKYLFHRPGHKKAFRVNKKCLLIRFCIHNIFCASLMPHYNAINFSHNVFFRSFCAVKWSLHVYPLIEKHCFFLASFWRSFWDELKGAKKSCNEKNSSSIIILIPDKSPSDHECLVNGCLIEYKWFQPHFTANLFHLPLFLSFASNVYRSAQGSNDNKKVILHHHLMIQTIIGNEHLKQLMQTPLKHDTTSSAFMYQYTITKWFICKYVNGNWFAYIERNVYPCKNVNPFESRQHESNTKFTSQTCT